MEAIYDEMEYKLEANSELRFGIESIQGEATITLKTGFAELFGTELVKNNDYKFVYGAQAAIFTYVGCTLTVRGEMTVCYISKDTPMRVYLNCHAALENLRNDAEETDTRGPVAMIVGSQDVGKSTLCRIMLNYAARVSRRPLYVDLDVGQGNISIPGTVGAMFIERAADYAEGFQQKAPIVYHFGCKSPGDNIELYNSVVEKMATAMLKEIDSKFRAKHSGILINTCGWVKGAGYRSILHAAKVFAVNAIFVLDNELCYNELLRDMPGINIVLLPKSRGVVDRSTKQRQEQRDFRTKSYFYGPAMQLFPHSIEIAFKDLRIYKIGGPEVPDSCLPLGMNSKDNKLNVVAVPPSRAVLHHVLAISFAESPEEDVIGTNLLGFIGVTDINMEKQKVTVLTPESQPLPLNKLLLLTEIHFVDSQN